MSSIVSQLQALWVIRASLPPCSPPHHNQQQQEEGREEEEWRPWKLVHPHTKPGSQHQLNSMGKYCVKLFWMVSVVLLLLITPHWKELYRKLKFVPFCSPSHALSVQRNHIRICGIVAPYSGCLSLTLGPCSSFSFGVVRVLLSRFDPPFKCTADKNL